MALVLLAALIAAGPAAARAPQPEASGSSDWRTVTSGEADACGIRTSGRLYCWGYGSYGQVGDGGNVDRGTPTQVAGGFTDWTRVSAGTALTCAIRGTGRLYCWGRDDFGAVGDGPAATGGHSTPHAVTSTFTNWSSVSAGDAHACGIRAGRAYCWGHDNFGQLGDGGAPTDRNVPHLVAGGFTDWTVVAAGSDHTCGRRANGTLWCWGADGDGQVGDGGGPMNRSAPRLVAGGATNWTMVTAGDRLTCGLRVNHRAYCWGDDDAGAVGDDTHYDDQYAPALVVGTGWASVDAGTRHACGRRTNGTLWCWGTDDEGQLGNGSSTDSGLTPSRVGHATDWRVVTAGFSNGCATTSTGRLYCWGSNANAQLGLGVPLPFVIEPTEVHQ